MNRFNPFYAARMVPVAAVNPQKPLSPIDQLPAYAKRLIMSVWNDHNALGLLTAMWGSAIASVMQDIRPRDPGTVQRMLAVNTQLQQRLAELPRVEPNTAHAAFNERPGDWDDYRF